MALSPLPEFLPFSPPQTDEDELKELTETLSSGWLSRGPKCDLFERALAEYLGAPEVLALSSCTAALHLALAVLGVGPGDGALTSPLTFVSTCHAAAYLGARPFLADIDPKTGCLDPALAEEFLAKKCRIGEDGRPKHLETGRTIAAILPVHYGGQPADPPAFWELAQKWNVPLVEDAAHAIGSKSQGLLIGDPRLKPKGAPPGLTCFSFYATKNLAAGEGGALTASDPELLAKARELSAYGIDDGRRLSSRPKGSFTWDYDVRDLGFKYNFTDLQAALALAQLRKLPRFLADRRARAAIWTQTLAPLSHLVETPKESPFTESSWHLYPLLLKTERLKKSREEICLALSDLNVGTSVMFKPIHRHSYYQKALGYEMGSFPLAESFYAREISLPISPAHSLKAVQMAADLLAALLLEAAL
jgi:dTDP-4-amino-4,6-dideoxygalactose transaminase